MQSLDCSPKAVALVGSKPGYEPTLSSPQISTDSSFSQMIPRNEATAEEKRRVSWEEDKWVWNHIHMVAEPVASIDGEPEAQVFCLDESKGTKRKARPCESGVSSMHASESSSPLAGESTVVSASAQRVVDPLTCQVDQCNVDLTCLKNYNQRYKVCEKCIKHPSVTINGKAVRFCQQCSCFHDLVCFDGKKRSCREQLVKHNRRRKERLDEAALKTKQAGASDIVVADNISGFTGKRTRVMTPMDSVSSDQIDISTHGGFQSTMSGLASAFHGQSSIATGSHQQVVGMDSDAFNKTLQASAAQFSKFIKTEGVVSQGNLTANVLEVDGPMNMNPPQELGSPNSGDLSVLRQLAQPNSYFVMPNAHQPILSGASMTHEFDRHMESLMNDFGPVGMPSMREMHSFNDWFGKLSSTSSGSNLERQQAAEFRAQQYSGIQQEPALQPSNSLENQWENLQFKPEASHESFSFVAGTNLCDPSNSQGRKSCSAMGPQVTRHQVVGGVSNVMNVSEDVLQDALDLLQEPMTTVYTPPPDQLVRLSLKMFNRSPANLKPDMRERLHMVASGGAAAINSNLQYGCTHLVVDMLVSEADACRSPAELAEALASGPLAARMPEDHFLNGKGVVQGPYGAAVRVEDGKVVASTDSSPSAPTLLGADSNVVCNASERSRVVLYVVHDLAVGPVSGLSVAVRNSGSYVGSVVEDTALLGAAPTYSPTASLVRLTLVIPTGQLPEGLLMIEVVYAGILSAPLPMVVTSNTVIMRELSQLGPARPFSKGQDALKALDARLVADLGLVLGSLANCGAGLGRGEDATAHGVSIANTAARARALLLVAAERGWAAVASALLDAAAADCKDVNHAVALTDAIRGPKGPGLLIAAVRGGNPVLLALLLDWATENGSGIPLDVMAPHGGVSPLHVSAAYGDGGVMAELLLQHAAPGDPVTQYSMWSDPNGRRISPESVAKKCCKRTQSRMEIKRSIGHDAEEQQSGRNNFTGRMEDELSASRRKPASGKKSIWSKARKTWRFLNSFTKPKKKRLEGDRGQAQSASSPADGASSSQPPHFYRSDSAASWNPSLPAPTFSSEMPVHFENEHEDREGSFTASLPNLPSRSAIAVLRTDSAREQVGVPTSDAKGSVSPPLAKESFSFLKAAMP